MCSAVLSSFSDTFFSSSFHCIAHFQVGVALFTSHHGMIWSLFPSSTKIYHRKHRFHANCSIQVTEKKPSWYFCLFGIQWKRDKFSKTCYRSSLPFNWWLPLLPRQKYVDFSLYTEIEKKNCVFRSFARCHHHHLLQSIHTYTPKNAFMLRYLNF